MNNKIVSVVLVAGIAATGFAGLSSASETQTWSFFKWNTEIKELFEKVKSGAELTADEQAILDEVRASKGEKGKKGAKHGGKRKGGGNLTDEEKTALEAMSDDEKKAFFTAKKAEMNAQKEAGKAVIDKLINGESLTADEETTRLELLAKIESKSTDGKKLREGTALMIKVLAGSELTAEDEAALAEKQAKSAEREAQKAILEPIKAKLDAGEELSEEEQAVLDEMKANKSEGKRSGKKGGSKGHGKKGNRGDREQK